MRINLRCQLLFGSFYAFVCVISSFITYYLDTFNYSNKQIGILVAVSSAAGAILQFFAGRIADKYPNLYWRNQLLFFSILSLILSMSRIMFDAAAWEFISSGILLVLLYLMMPMVNQACFYYTNNGQPVNFGVARGVGAICFAAASFGVGKATGAMGQIAVPLTSTIFLCIVLITAFILPKIENAAAAVKEPAVQAQRSTGFVRKYSSFLVVTIGITLVLMFHNFVNTYFLRITESIGGDSSHMGVALGIAAASELPILFLYSKIARIRNVTSKLLIIVGCSVFVLRGILYLLIDNMMLLYAFQLLQSVSFGFLVASKATYSNEVMSENDKTTGQSIMSMTDSVGAVLGSLIGGMIIHHAGLDISLISGTFIAAIGTVMIILTSLRRQARTVNQ